MMTNIARRLLIALALVFLLSPVAAADAQFPIRVGDRLLSREQLQNLLRLNSVRMRVAVRQLAHQGASFTPNLTTLDLRPDNLEAVAARALELDKILDAALPTGSTPLLRGEKLAAALEYFQREGKAPPIETGLAEFAQLDDRRFPLDVGYPLNRTEFHALLVKNSARLHEQERDLRDKGLSPRFVNLRLTARTSKEKLEAVAIRAVRLDNLFLRFENYRKTMPFDDFISALHAHQVADLETIQQFLNDWPLKKST